jgi:RND superfamily putative drug exporter
MASGLTTLAGNILMLACGRHRLRIFIFGRHREARGMGEDRDTAYYTTARSVAPVIVGSGLTIAGATYCLSLRVCLISAPWASPSRSE